MANPYTDERSPHLGCGWIVVALFAVLFLVACCGGTLIGGYVLLDKHLKGDSTEVDDNDRSPRGDKELVRLIERAGVEPAHAVYFSKYCRGVAATLEGTFGARDAVIDTRAEALAVYGVAGQMAVAGKSVNKYPELRDFFEALAREALGSDEAGALTKDDQDSVVDSWQRAADAFAEVGN